MPPHPPAPPVLLFDVNETLLDLSPLKRRIGDLLGDPGQADLWFATTLQYSLVLTVSGRYESFSDIGAAALGMLARNAGQPLPQDEAKDIVSAMRRLAPHPDVVPALERLRASGRRLAVLTNSAQAGVAAQLAHAGLEGYFERQLSVESVGKFKPHAAVYRWAVREMGAEPGDCLLVAAHGWDVAGAKQAGLRTAFIARPGQQKFPLGPGTDLDAADLSALADRLGA